MISAVKMLFASKWKQEQIPTLSEWFDKLWDLFMLGEKFF